MLRIAHAVGQQRFFGLDVLQGKPLSGQHQQRQSPGRQPVAGLKAVGELQRQQNQPASRPLQQGRMALPLVPQGVQVAERCKNSLV